MKISTIFLKNPKPLNQNLIFLRHMGGGPRTFPGGLNKWQWKRMHEKKAREKEKRLLDQEKQVYQARIRSEIRANVASSESPDQSPLKAHQNKPNYGPLSPQDHVKALADRFMKEGAEDLWNDNDGPEETKAAKARFVSEGVDLERIVKGNRSFGCVDDSGFSRSVSGNVGKDRFFSSYSRASFESSDLSRSVSCNVGKDRFFSSYSRRSFESSDLSRSGSGNVGKGRFFSTYSRGSFESSDLLRSLIGNVGKDRFFSTYSSGSVEISGFSRSLSGNVGKNRFFSTYAIGISNSLMGDYRNECLRTMSNEFGLVGGLRRGILMGVTNVLNLKCYYSVGAGSIVPKKTNFGRNGQKPLTDYGSDSKSKSGDGKKTKWPRRFRVNSSDDDTDDDYDDEEEVESGSSGKDFRSSAALGKYDYTIKKRVPLKFLEEEMDLSQQVEEIRKEVNQRRIAQEDEKAEEESILSNKRFDECGVSPLTVRALTEAGYVQMTRVQEATISTFHEGKDALVKARSGTGKSIAFLLPAIETVLKASSSGSKVQRVPPIYVLILCPTRELASQICAEANVLLKHHNGIGVQTLVGGTRFKVDQKRLESDPSQIIVATPGRLLDHVENKSGVSVRLMGLHMLILDEADYLLDLGFRRDVEKIVDCLPRKKQSLLFSSTLPKEVRRISQLVLKREHAYIDTVGLGSVDTHAKVKQFYLVAPHEQHLELVHHLLKSHTSQVPDYKVMVFCATAMMTSLMGALLREMKMNVREINTKQSPLYSTRISNEFKESKGLILITSDVSARGMNYPDVTLVIQVGIPTDRGQYIHRLGRTGRQGKEGEGLLLLAPWEQYFLDELKDLPLEKSDLPHLDPSVKAKIEESMGRIDESVKESAYHAWLGYYNSINAIGRDKTTLVEMANQFSASIGLQKPPALYRKTAIKMGLKDIPGIRIRK